MIVVHHLEHSRSQRVLWLLEELGVLYEVRRYARDRTTRLAPAELLAVHPLGKSPVITDDGRTVAETGAIVEYLVGRHGGLGQPEGDEGLRYRYWLHFAEGSAIPPLVMTLLFGEVPKRAPALIRPIARHISEGALNFYARPTLAKQWDYIESELTRSPWFAGPAFTAADVMMSFPLEAARTRGLGPRPAIEDWLARIHSRPAYAAALAKGGPYAYA